MNTVAGLQIEWAFKRSFLQYVSGLPDGRGQLSGGATVAPNGAFRFPATASPGLLVSVGAVRFIGHGGALDLEICAPTIALTPNGLNVSLDTEAGPLVVATSPDLTTLDAGTVIRALVLSEAGRDVFGGFYPAGTELEPITLIA